MFDMGAEMMALPMEEKMKYEQGDDGMSFGFAHLSSCIPSCVDEFSTLFVIRYKVAGANAVDATGTRDTIEFINVAKDDALAWPAQARRAYPSTVNARMASTITPFIRKSLEVNNTLLELFNEKLGLPKGALAERHSMEEHSGSEARITKSPPSPFEIKMAIGAHTDFGSLVSRTIYSSLVFVIHSLHDSRSSIIGLEDYKSSFPGQRDGCM